MRARAEEFCVHGSPAPAHHATLIFLHRYRSPTDAKNSSSATACRRAALSPCSESCLVSTCTGCAIAGRSASTGGNSLQGHAADERPACCARLGGHCDGHVSQVLQPNCKQQELPRGANERKEADTP